MVVSITTFHGRGFFQPSSHPAKRWRFWRRLRQLIGLLIEITFIATFTQRFFAR